MTDLNKISILDFKDVTIDDVFENLKEDFWIDAGVASSRYSSELGSGVNKEIRDAKVAIMKDGFYKFLNDSIEPHVIEYAKKNNIEIIENTGYTVTRYLKGQFFADHVDSTVEFPRKISIILYLNDNYEGGTLTFTKIKKTFKPKANSLFIFPSDENFKHSADPVESGIKYVIVGFWK